MTYQIGFFRMSRRDSVSGPVLIPRSCKPKLILTDDGWLLRTDALVRCCQGLPSPAMHAGFPATPLKVGAMGEGTGKRRKR